MSAKYSAPSAEENAREYADAERLRKANAGVIRERALEAYPPPDDAQNTIAQFRDYLVQYLEEKRGFTRKQIERMAKTLENFPKDAEGHRARRALFFIGRFTLAWERGDWKHAAYFAWQAGRAAEGWLNVEANKDPSSLSDLGFGGSLRSGCASGFPSAASDRLLMQRCEFQQRPNSSGVLRLIKTDFGADQISE